MRGLCREAQPPGMNAIYEILKSRAAVFVVEQNIVYQDMDDKDYDSLHVYCEDGA